MKSKPGLNVTATMRNLLGEALGLRSNSPHQGGRLMPHGIQRQQSHQFCMDSLTTPAKFLRIAALTT